MIPLPFISRKADSRIDGSYNILNQEFARHIPEQYVYLNREEDLGIPGLRKGETILSSGDIIGERVCRIN